MPAWLYVQKVLFLVHDESLSCGRDLNVVSPPSQSLLRLRSRVYFVTLRAPATIVLRSCIFVSVSGAVGRLGGDCFNVPLRGFVCWQGAARPGLSPVNMLNLSLKTPRNPCLTIIFIHLVFECERFLGLVSIQWS